MDSRSVQKNAVGREECCPKFEPAPWDEKIVEWNEKRFIKDRVFTLFYLPLNYGAVMKRIDEKVRNAGAVMQDGLALSDHTSKKKDWRG